MADTDRTQDGPTRRQVAILAIPFAAGVGAVASRVLQSEPAHAQPLDGSYHAKTLEDFGAKGDFDLPRGTGTDDTAAIQAAIDWAYDGGKSAPRALMVSSKNFLCGPITTHPTTTLIGTGRHTSAFSCRDGTTGKWWSDRGNGAQKLMLSGIAWYGREQPGLSHVLEFGNQGIQFGSEGVLQGLWTRDAPRATGLAVNGNVGIISDLTTQSCDRGLEVLGNGNQLQNIFVMQCRIGAELAGSFVRGLHIEATASDGIPLRIYGDCHVSDMLQSPANGTAFDQLVWVDTRNYDQWSLSNIQVIDNDYKITRGLLRVGDRFIGGTDRAQWAGATFVPSVHTAPGGLAMGGQRWRTFSVELASRGGKLLSSIRPSGNAAPSAKVPGSSPPLAETMLAASAQSAFRGDVAVLDDGSGHLILGETLLTGPDASAGLWSVQYNSSGNALAVEPYIAAYTAGHRQCLALTTVDGTAFDPRRLRDGSRVVIGFAGFIG